MNREDAIYCAALLDAMAYISTKDNKPIVTVKTKNKHVLETLERHLGGSTYRKRWTVTYRKAKTAIMDVYPFMRLKKDKALQLIEHYKDD